MNRALRKLPPRSNLQPATLQRVAPTSAATPQSLDSHAPSTSASSAPLGHAYSRVTVAPAETGAPPAALAVTLPRHETGVRAADPEPAFSRATDAMPQAKLEVNQPDDVFEQEADAVADAVVGASATASLASGAPGGLAQRVASAGPLAAEDVSGAVRAGLSGGGQPLDPATRADMEHRLGHDFSRVRVHTDARASDSTAALRASAYTVGDAIAFRAGTYRPDVVPGRHLLAHELTHVIQQGAAQPLAQQRAAHSVAPVAAKPAAAQLVQRDDPPGVKPYAGPAPANPFPAPAAGKQVDVSQLVTSSMQALASDMVNHAYASYLSAVATVKAKLQGEKKDQEEKDKATRELVLGLVLLPLGLAAPAIGAAAVSAIPGVRNALVKRIEVAVPNMLKAQGLSAQDAIGITAAATADLDGLIAKATAENAAKGVESLGEKAKGAAAKVSLAGGPFDQAQAFLDACAFAADQNSKALMSQVFVTSDFSELMGIYHTFSTASLEVYTADLDGRAHHFMTELGSTPGKVESVVELAAYGRNRLARVRYNTTSANYFFIAWITPDMEAIARQLYPDPTKLPNSMIVNHLPVPMEETGERIVTIDAWGKDRLALVMVEEGKTGAGRADEVTQYQFVKWFSAQEQVMARTKAEQQIGGANRVRPDRVQKLQAPTE